jgi:hypothetical protein
LRDNDSGDHDSSGTGSGDTGSEYDMVIPALIL